MFTEMEVAQNFQRIGSCMRSRNSFPNFSAPHAALSEKSRRMFVAESFHTLSGSVKYLKFSGPFTISPPSGSASNEKVSIVH